MISCALAILLALLQRFNHSGRPLDKIDSRATAHTPLCANVALPIVRTFSASFSTFSSNSFFSHTLAGLETQPVILL